METVILILVSIMLAVVVILAFAGRIWIEKYSKKLAEYTADFEYLPELTRKVDSIKNELHQTTELRLGYKSEERRAIFEMADAIANAINYCLHTSTYIIDDSDDIQVRQTQNEVWKSLRQLTIAQTQFEILCESVSLKQAVSDVVISIHHQLQPQVHPFLFGLIKHNINMRSIVRKQDLLFEAQNKPIDQIKSELDGLIGEQEKLLAERLEFAKSHAEQVMVLYKDIVGPLRKIFIHVAHSYLKQLMSTNPLASDKILPNKELSTNEEKNDTLSLTEPIKTLLDDRVREKASVSPDPGKEKAK